ncbi:MAG TPA: hypothetical protein VGV61_10800, partial [Thermoanaerobaculia bacterium]|nr:hypothetical protein [Thermoanaerobaculia bacterium]
MSRLRPKRPGRRGLLVALLLSLLGAAARPGAAALCAIDAVPGATLLYPFFEVDLADRQARDTVISAENTGTSPVVAHVTLWTDWAIPVFAFDVYLAPLDVQRVSLAELILDGRLPATGSAVSPRGRLSGLPVAFPGCNNGTTPGAAPVYADPALPVALRNHLQSQLTGHASPLTGQCAGENRGTAIARGYVTIDANDQCTLLFPSDAGYFAGNGPTTRRNVLAGDFAVTRPGGLHVWSFPAVALEAAPEGSPLPGSRT